MGKFTPDPNDPLKIRRYLALLSAFYAMFVWPNLLILYHIKFGLPEDTIKEMLLYIGVVSSGPIGAYIWAAMKQQNGDNAGSD